jgi:integrase
MRLTAKSVATLKLPAGKTDHITFDDRIPGFGYRQRAGGGASWIFQYALGRAKQRRMVIGKATALTPEKARELAADLHAKVRLGGDPAANKAVSKAAAAFTFGVVVDRFLDYQKIRLRPRSYVEASRHLLKNARTLHAMPISSLERDRRSVAALLSGLADSVGAVTANRTRATLSALFTWAMKEGLAENNPVANTNKQAEHSRNRVLTDAEIRIIWNALEDDHYGNVLRMLLLTGCRANEIAGLQWSEIDFDKGLILLPAERVKNARAHLVPMAPTVVDVLQAQPRTDDGLVFGYEGRPFSSWTHGKNRLEARITEMTGGALPNWTPHDLRRTCATRMADIGVLPHVVEAVLNHASGHKHGIAGIYNHSVYAAEKAQALALWATHVLTIVENKKPTVVALRA